MCDVLKCKRAEFFFANADYFDNVENHAEETVGVVIVVLALLQKKGKVTPDFVDKWTDKLRKEKQKGSSLANLMRELYNKEVVY